MRGLYLTLGAAKTALSGHYSPRLYGGKKYTIKALIVLGSKTVYETQEAGIETKNN